DLEVLSRPVTYLTWESRSTDNRSHKVLVYFDAEGAMAADTTNQALNFQEADTSNIKAWRVGTVKQAVLQKKGDDVRIDWGYFYLALAGDSNGALTANRALVARAAFLSNGSLPEPDAVASLNNNNRDDTVLACRLSVDSVPGQTSSAWLMLAYDDLFSIQYMQ